MNVRLGLAVGMGVVAVSAWWVVAQEAPAPQARLQQLLKLFPEADANGDGVLTAAEARSYRDRVLGGNRPAGGAQPQNIADALPATHANVSYGPHANNKFDLWLAPSDKPNPLLIFIHGGGFVGGDKNSVNRAHIRQCLDAGVSFASINYRFRTEVPINTVLRDSARAVQYLRYKADEYNLDKTRFAAFGGSAGAGTSLWLAYHDDLADPEHTDPVLRESTRLVAACSTAGQATYDVKRWPEVLGIDNLAQFHPTEDAPNFYGLESLADLDGEEGCRLRADVDMLAHISPDDPPVLLIASARHDALTSRSAVNHSRKHSEAVKARCDEVGITAELAITDGEQKTAPTSPVAFLLRYVQPQP